MLSKLGRHEIVFVFLSATPQFQIFCIFLVYVNFTEGALFFSKFQKRHFHLSGSGNRRNFQNVYSLYSKFLLCQHLRSQLTKIFQLFYGGLEQRLTLISPILTLVKIQQSPFSGTENLKLVFHLL